MASSILTILGALATILGPILAAAVAAWVDKKHEESLHATLDETDEYIKQILAGNPVGRIMLARQLERLQSEARRKYRDPRQP